MLTLLALFAPTAFAADHIIYLDFDTAGFDLSAFDGSFTADDEETAKQMILHQVAKDFAAYEVTVTREEPGYGRYTRAIIGGNAAGLFGTVGTDASYWGYTGTGIDSWEDSESIAFIFPDNFADNSAWMDSNSTLARITNAIAHTTSHEVGHVLGLIHDHSYDDYPTNTDTSDNTEHIMCNSDRGLTDEERATLDRYFSQQVSAELLSRTQQVRNYHRPLADADADGMADTLTSWFIDPDDSYVWVGTSNGSSFDLQTDWATDVGQTGDIYLTGDINGDGDSDIVFGHIEGSHTVSWWVSRSYGTYYGTPTEWRTDVGSLGDIYRMADINGDGMDDLVYGRKVSSTQTTWYACTSSGSTFNTAITLISDAGDEGDLFFFGDVDVDGDDDLVYGRIQSSTDVDWWVRRSSGTTLGSLQTWSGDSGNQYDRFLLADVGGDGDADLVAGRNQGTLAPGGGSSDATSNTTTWYAFGANPSTSSFGSAVTWSSDIGNTGDAYRLGDADGDGRNDLINLSRSGFVSVYWYVAESSGSSFSSRVLWDSTGGWEGWLVY